ncbi:MAG: N-acetyl-gamma-glutamyl-phosphate reductase [Oscillospiraceae bacterium]|jgi:N-acetyl-gamma-glutamyl-phosphate reductase|nr:N-acetyl-gamma-glutamyl-phosphate reductase [Oscillospiraceae bacterium]
MTPKIYIDGAEGTTGLQIHERLGARRDIELLCIADALRKDTAERRRLINAADLVFLCLPDAAAVEAVALIDNPHTRVIDASTAHRVADGWVYGLPELSGAQRDAVRAARFVANPGCHATGAIMLLSPLVAKGVVPQDFPVVITSLTGYTGGGKKMIAEYETADRGERWDLNAPRAYGLAGNHKHLPEITRYAGLSQPPAFVPIVADYPQGMQVIIPLAMPRKSEMLQVLQAHYADCRNVDVLGESGAFEPSNVNADRDRVTLRVVGNDAIPILTAQFNNLGKGASGAAVQNMNLMLGFDEYAGLNLE